MDLSICLFQLYMGRVPALLHEWLSSIKAYKTPAALIVVYGSRVYDDALIELKDLCKNADVFRWPAQPI